MIIVTSKPQIVSTMTIYDSMIVARYKVASLTFIRNHSSSICLLLGILGNIAPSIFPVVKGKDEREEGNSGDGELTLDSAAQ